MIVVTGSAGNFHADVDYSALPGGERKSALIGVSVAFGILAIVAVLLRFIARRIRKNTLSWDDWSIVVALVFAIGVCVDSIVLATVGDEGAREFTLDGQLMLPKDTFTTLRYRRQIGAWILTWMYSLAYGSVKISVLLLYRRIFDVKVGQAFSVFRALLWFLLAVSIMWTIASFFACFFICHPIDAFFLVELNKCIHFEKLWRILAISDVILDGSIIILPLQPLRRLQLPLRRKIGILAIFSTGAVVVIAGIVRTAIFYNVIGTVSRDAAYHNQPATLWAMIEACMGVTGACLPCMTPLFGARGVKTMVESIRSKISVSSLRRSNDLEDEPANEGAPKQGS